MTREEVVRTIEDIFDLHKIDRCASQKERQEVDNQVAEILTWIAETQRPPLAITGNFLLDLIAEIICDNEFGAKEGLWERELVQAEEAGDNSYSHWKLHRLRSTAQKIASKLIQNRYLRNA